MNSVRISTARYIPVDIDEIISGAVVVIIAAAVVVGDTWFVVVKFSFLFKITTVGITIAALIRIPMIIPKPIHSERFLKARGLKQNSISRLSHK